MLKRIPKFYYFLLFTSLIYFSTAASNQVQENKVQQLLDSCIQLRNISLDSSIDVCKQAIDLSVESLDYKQLPLLYKNQGTNYYYKGVYDSAIVYYEKSIPLYLQLDQKVDVGKVTVNIGIVLTSQSKYDQALEYFFKGLKYYEEENFLEGYGNVFQSIGNIFQRLEKLDESEKYYHKALDKFAEAQNFKAVKHTYANLGSLILKRGDFNQAKQYLRKALLANDESEDVGFQARTLYNLGYLFKEKNELDSAIYYLKKSEKIRERLGVVEGLIYSKYELAQVEILKKNYSEAEVYIKKCYEIAHSCGQIDWLLDILPELISLNKRRGKYKEALTLQEELIEMKDSINVKEVNDKWNVLVQKYEKEQNEKEIELLEKKTEIQNLKLGKKNAWIIILLFILLLGVFAVFVSLRVNRLRADHKIMDLRQKVLLTQMNPHFLFNALTSIQSFILDEKNKEANNYLARLASLVRGILENSREEFVCLKIELDTLSDYIEMQKLRFDNDISYQFDIDDQLDLNQIMIPPMLAQPFVENALIHGRLRNNPDAKITIKIDLLEKEQFIKFQILDNGIGIEAAMQESGQKGHRSLATSIAMDRVKIYNFKSKQKMNFEIIDLKNIDSNLTGTRVSYSIPLVRNS